MTDVPPPLPGAAQEAPGDAAAGPPPPLPSTEAYSGAPRGADGSPWTRRYPCPNCNGAMEWSARAGALLCPNCGHQRAVEAGEYSPERDYASTLASLREAQSSVLTHQADAEHEIVCRSCGAHTTFTGTLTATRCPYCATPVQRDDVQDAPARLPVDGVVPFGVDTKQAEESVKNWINGRWFAPNDFKKYNKTGSFTGIYASFFTYDADTVTAYTGERGDDYTVTVGSGENQHTETRTRWRHASGVVQDVFDDVAVLANEGFDHDRIRKLEPWPTQTAQPFRQEYIAGFLCRTYDRDLEVCCGDAKGRMDDQIVHTVKQDIGGDHQRVHQRNTEFRTLTYRHLLLPLFLLTVLFAGKPYQVFVNGVSGEVQGERPYSKVKIALAVLLALILIGVGLAVYAANKSSESAVALAQAFRAFPAG